jgi:hypothetical protein
MRLTPQEEDHRINKQTAQASRNSIPELQDKRKGTAERAVHANGWINFPTWFFVLIPVLPAKARWPAPCPCQKFSRDSECQYGSSSI